MRLGKFGRRWSFRKPGRKPWKEGLEGSRRPPTPKIRSQGRGQGALDQEKFGH